MLDCLSFKIDVMTMRRLILLRHAKSDWPVPGIPDQERALNRRGQESATKIGAYMARHGLIPDRVLCSSARRAKETWIRVAAELPQAPDTVYEDRLYNATPDVILDLARKIKGARSVLLVGHNPGLEELAGLLIASGDLEHRERLRQKFPTAGLAVVDFAIDDWRKLHPHAGRLERFVAPRSLETATD